MNPLDILKTYFSSAGTAEGDGNILDEAFVPLQDFLKIVNPPYASPRLLVGRKGSGKSAFVRFFKNRMNQANVPILLLKPENMELDSLNKQDAIGQMVKAAKEVLLLAIAKELSLQLKGFLTTKDEQILDAFATGQGLKPKDWLQQLHGVLINVAKDSTAVDFQKITDQLHGVSSDQLKEAIYRNAGKQHKAFYILVDDTDQVASPDDGKHLNRIWAFILAARSILQDCDSIRFVITLRLEVWTRLQRDAAGQRDQVDHVRGFVYPLNPTEEHVKQVVNRRLELAITEIRKKNPTKRIDYLAGSFAPFFEGQGITLPGTNFFTSWQDLIVKRSRERPRDAIQLVAHLIATAEEANRKQITERDAPISLKKYSEERADDLKREGDNECPVIKEIIRSFAKLPYDRESFKASAEVVKKHLLSLPSRFSIQLLGATLHPDNEEDAFFLWRYLYDVGFFGARIKDEQQARGFNHSMVLENPDLINKSRWSAMQAYTWEINPAYRDFLLAENRFF
jgi:hypothetical protein